MMILPCVILLFSLITFLLYGIDKRRAVKHRWRISEATLLLFSVIGGMGRPRKSWRAFFLL